MWVDIPCSFLFSILSTDELRRHIEALEKDLYFALSYYERWSIAMTNILLERGVLTQRDIDEQLGHPVPLQDQEAAKFSVGDYVRIGCEDTSKTIWRKPHLRTPGYIHGRIGIITGLQGVFPNPSFLAFQGLVPLLEKWRHSTTAPQVHLYSVEFNRGHLWTGYPGEHISFVDTVDVDVYQPWLTLSSKAEYEAQHHEAVAQAKKSHGDEDDHHHDHSEPHVHNDGEEPHVHDLREDVEQTAVIREGEESFGEYISVFFRSNICFKGPLFLGERFANALIRALLNSEVITADELRAAVESLEVKRADPLGRKVVVRAWLDPEFAHLLRSDPGRAVRNLLNIDVSNPNAPTRLTCLFDTPDTHYLVACTLCSCYPNKLLGFSPAWYKSRSFRTLAVRDPRILLRKFGCVLPEERRICVKDSTADHRYMVIPLRPEGTEGWSEEQLESIVTRDTMIGVTIPKIS
jgi:nitrile hydratase